MGINFACGPSVLNEKHPLPWHPTEATGSTYPIFLYLDRADYCLCRSRAIYFWKNAPHLMCLDESLNRIAKRSQFDSYSAFSASPISLSRRCAANPKQCSASKPSSHPSHQRMYSRLLKSPRIWSRTVLPFRVFGSLMNNTKRRSI